MRDLGIFRILSDSSTIANALERCQKMVHDINENVVAPKDRLLDNVFLFMGLGATGVAILRTV